MAALTALLALWTELSLGLHSGFARSSELLTVAQTAGRATSGISHRLLEMIDEQATTLDSIAGFLVIDQDLELDGGAIRVSTELVTKQYFPALRPRMQLGRAFNEVDHKPGGEPTVIVSDSFWREYLGGRPDAIGSMLRLRGMNTTLSANDATSNPADKVRSYRVIGVLAPEMPGTLLPSETVMLMPFEAVTDYWFAEAGGFEAIRNTGLLLGSIARSSSGASVAAVRSELSSRIERSATELGFGPLQGYRLDAVRGVVRSFPQQRGALRQARLLLGGSVLLALVAACNVSLFLLSRAPSRRREFAIRLAVGAPTRRLARQLVAEAGMLVAAATVLGGLLSLWTTALASDLAFFRDAVSGRDVTPFNWRVLAAVAGFALLVTALVSIAPVSRLNNTWTGTGSRGVTARATSAQRIVGTLQLAFAAAIGAAALAFVWYLREVTVVDPGFSASSVTVAMLSPSDPTVSSSPIDVHMRDREHRRDVLAAIPGVEDVAFGTSVPGQLRRMWTTRSAPPDDPQEDFAVTMQAVDGNYMPILDVTVLDGRLLEDDDRDRIVVNETLARRLWGRVDVAGEILPLAIAARLEVVGVIKDITYSHPADVTEPMAYMIASQLVPYDWALLKTSLPAAEIRRVLQEKVESDELDVQLGSVIPIDLLWGESLAADRMRTGLTIAAALLAAALAMFGYYGTQHYLVAAGRREYAIRSAIGAGPGALGRLVLTRGLLLGAPGLVLGGLLAFITVAWLRDDYVSNSVSPALVTAAVLAASAALLVVSGLGPGRAARRTEPGQLLKQD